MERTQVIARDIVDEQTAHAGVQRQRVLSLLDRLHRNGMISWPEFAAGTLLRDQLMAEMAPSHGVSSYGGNVGHADASTKADRLGRRLTGWLIDYGGRVAWVGGRKQLRQAQAALLEVVGVRDDAGIQHLNTKHADILVRVVLETEQQPTLAAITRELTDFYGAKSKRQPAYGLGWLSAILTRLATWYGLIK